MAHGKQAARMSAVNMAQLADLQAVAAEENINFVRLIFADANGAACGKTVPADKFFAHASDGFHFARSGIAQDIEGENTPTPGFTAETGDSDFVAFPDLSTFQTVPYRPGYAQVLIVPTLPLPLTDGSPFPESSEGVLQRVLSRLAAAGYTAKLATESEFYLFRPGFVPVESGLHAYRHAPLDRLGPVIDDLVRYTEHLGLSVEGWIHEYAPGQIEINFAPDAPLTIARRTFLWKQMVRDVARLHGYEATFLAKPLADQSGSGTHVHISLWQDGKNVFHDTATGGASRTLLQFVAGQIAHTADLFLLYAPNINSYRRLSLGEYMPTSASWGNDDRRVAFRLLTGSANACRMEHRIAGADANPYLLIAGILAAGLAGVTGDYTAPEPNTAGISLASFPSSLPDATERFALSPFVQEQFGESFATLLASVKRQEWHKTMQYITDWERATYGPLV